MVFQPAVYANIITCYHSRVILYFLITRHSALPTVSFLSSLRLLGRSQAFKSITLKVQVTGLKMEHSWPLEFLAACLHVFKNGASEQRCYSFNTKIYKMHPHPLSDPVEWAWKIWYSSGHSEGCFGHPQRTKPHDRMWRNVAQQWRANRQKKQKEFGKGWKEHRCSLLAASLRLVAVGLWLTSSHSCSLHLSQPPALTPAQFTTSGKL